MPGGFETRCDGNPPVPRRRPAVRRVLRRIPSQNHLRMRGNHHQCIA